jgi:hypothetical protein
MAIRKYDDIWPSRLSTYDYPLMRMNKVMLVTHHDKRDKITNGVLDVASLSYETSCYYHVKSFGWIYLEDESFMILHTL